MEYGMEIYNVPPKAFYRKLIKKHVKSTRLHGVIKVFINLIYTKGPYSNSMTRLSIFVGVRFTVVRLL